MSNRDLVMPGDTINTYGETIEGIERIGIGAVKVDQIITFGYRSNYRPIHSMLYLDDEHIMSVENPCTIYRKASQVNWDTCDIYRINPEVIFELTEREIEWLRRACDNLVGTPYDYGQLLDIGISTLLGYPDVRKSTVFDMGRKMKVCSVGVRIAYEYMHKMKLQNDGIYYGHFTRACAYRGVYPKLLFSELNPHMWSPSWLKRYKGWNVENTKPAHFANSHLFCNEFVCITAEIAGYNPFRVARGGLNSSAVGLAEG